MRREPNHPKPLAGAGFAIGLTTFATAAGVVVSLRAGEAFPARLLVFPVLAALFALSLQAVDRVLLSLAQRERPPHVRRAWRRLWLIVPALAAALGAVTGALFEAR